jgi:hypothetical protein
MADIVTGTVTGSVDVTDLLKDHSDIRQEIADEGRTTVDAVKTAAWHNSDRTGTEADRIINQASQQFIAAQQYAFDAARDVAALKSATDLHFASVANEIKTQSALGQAAAALESAKVAAAIALGQATLSKEIFADGQKTRDLVNDLKYHDLNRALVERNAELVEERHYGRHWRGVADQNQFGAQFAQLQSMMQNFNSQLADTRQGMVNFGTMAGVGQTSTSNNVR